MACIKLGSKNDAFQRKGQAWFCTTGLPSDIVVEVGEMSFHLHKFPLLSRSGVMERLIAEASKTEEEGGSIIRIPSLPGGAKAFELVAKFCYGVKLELTASNIKQEIEKLGRVKGSSGSSTWGNVSKKFGFKLKSQMCSAQEGSVSHQKPDKVRERHGKHKAR